MSYVHHVLLHIISISFERASRMRQVHEWLKSKRITNQLTYWVSMRNLFFCYLYVSLVCFTGARMNGIFSNSLLPRWWRWRAFANFQKSGEFTRQPCGRLNPSLQVGTSRQFSRAKTSTNSDISNIWPFLTLFWEVCRVMWQSIEESRHCQFLEVFDNFK